MAENTKEKVVQEIKDLSPEEKAQAWEDWVRSEVNAALDIYLPKAISGNINVRYYPHVVEVLESGPQTDDSKADGVLLSIVFDFENPIDLTEPREKEEE
jgi:hypothetical protein